MELNGFELVPQQIDSQGDIYTSIPDETFVIRSTGSSTLKPIGANIGKFQIRRRLYGLNTCSAVGGAGGAVGGNFCK